MANAPGNHDGTTPGAPGNAGGKSMLAHVSIGVRDLERTKRFYDAALAPLGYKCLDEGASSLGYGGDAVVLWISPTPRPVPAGMHSGLRSCSAAPGRTSGAASRAGAWGGGGKDNGGPGLRTDYGPSYYAA